MLLGKPVSKTGRRGYPWPDRANPHKTALDAACSRLRNIFLDGLTWWKSIWPLSVN